MRHRPGSVCVGRQQGLNPRCRRPSAPARIKAEIPLRPPFRDEPAPVQQPDAPAGAVRAARPLLPDDVRLRTDGLQLRPHRQRARPYVVFGVLAALLRRRYRRPALRPQHHRRRRQDQRRRAEQLGAPITTITERFAAAYPRGHGDARRAAAGPRAGGDRAHPADRRDDRAPDRRAATPTPPKATCCSRSRASPATASSRVATPTTCSPARAWKSRRTNATRATSCCGSRRPTTSPAGTRPGAAAVPAGTSNARRWPPRTWARPSTSTPAAST